MAKRKTNTAVTKEQGSEANQEEVISPRHDHVNEEGIETLPHEESVVEEKDIIKEDVLGYLLEDCPINGTDEANSKDYVASITNGYRYVFPVPAGRTFNEAIQLGQSMTSRNLKEGQVLSFNPQRMTPFFFLPECGISLNPDNPTFTFKEEVLRSDQVSLVVQAIRSGDLVLGDYGMSRQVLHEKGPTIDVAAILSKGEVEIRQQLKELIAGQTKINEDGSIESPGVDMKAMLDYEIANQNRQKIVAIIRKALHEVGGMVEYIADNVVDEELRRKGKDDQDKLSKQYDKRSGSVGTSTGFGKESSVGDFL